MERIRVGIQFGTRDDADAVSYTINCNKADGIKAGFDKHPEIKWISGPSGGAWSTENKEAATAIALSVGQFVISDVVTNEAVIDLTPGEPIAYFDLIR